MGKNRYVCFRMLSNDRNTEQKILDAAGEVVHLKGFDGARMQEIASKAGINKGLLHYYFKTKDALFDAIFGTALKQVISRILSILEQDCPLEEKIDRLIDQYMAMLLLNPGLPRFVLNELNKNAKRFVARHLDKNVRAAFDRFTDSVNQQAKQGIIRPIDARQLFTNLLSLLIFPFVGAPMLQTLFGADDRDFRKLLEARTAHIKDFFHQALRP